VDTARSLDGLRLISAAMEVHGDKQNPDLGIVDDPFGEFTGAGLLAGSGWRAIPHLALHPM
jgi:hypothetical protein